MQLAVSKIIIVSFIACISIALLLLKHFKINAKKILVSYVSAIFLASIYICTINFTNISKMLFSINLVILFIVLLISIAVYIADACIKNIVKNDVLIVDYKYYFTGKFNTKILAPSIAVGLMEELIFRLGILQTGSYIVGLLLYSSICFGVMHLFFSKYDVITKALLGIILGTLYLYTMNIFYPIVMHLSYNLLVSQQHSTKTDENLIREEQYVYEGH